MPTQSAINRFVFLALLRRQEGRSIPSYSDLKK